MKGKQLIILIVVAAALAGLAVMTSRKEQQVTARVAIGSKVMPGLATRLNDIKTVAIETPAATTQVARIDGVWRVPGKYNYPADFGKLRGLLNRLAELKALQALRTTPVERGDLRLLTDADTGATNTATRATTLRFLDKDARTITSLHLGKNRNRPAPEGQEGPGGGYPDSRFVMTDMGQVLLVGETLQEADSRDKDWLDMDFLNVNSADIVAIQVTGSTNGDLQLSRPASGGEMELTTAIPSGKEVDSSKLGRTGSALGYLRFEDVADPALTRETTGLAKPVTYQARTAKGEIYTLRIGKGTGSDNYYASVNVAFEAPPAPASPATGTNAVAAAKAQADANARTAEAVKLLNGKLSPWTYVLSQYSVEALTMGLGDVLKDKPKDEKKDGKKDDSQKNDK